ncbi:hypothetical protein J7L48_01935 [bacterium]|nr:hypothetical protein [bacterium]
MKSKFLCKVCKTPSLIIFLFLANVVFANENIPELFKTASLWQVGENKDIVQNARDKLVKINRPVLQWIYENKLNENAGSLELRAIVYIFKNAGSSTDFIVKKFKVEKSNKNLKWLLYLAGIIKDEKLISYIEKAHEKHELLLSAVFAYSKFEKILNIKVFKKAYKKANIQQKIKLINVIGNLKYKALYPFLKKIKGTTKNPLIYFAIVKTQKKF